MKLVIFGAGPFASLAWYCLSHDSPYEVAGFTVDAGYLTEPELHGLPVVDFASLEQTFGPGEHHILLPVSAHARNGLRRDRYLAAKARGYACASWISSRALTWPDLTHGDNVMVFEGAMVQPFARIGCNTIIRSGCHVSHHAVVEDHCFLAPRACLGGGAVIKARSFIGLNATVRDNITVAPGSFIAAGAVVTSDTEPEGLYMGVPARRVER